MNRLGLVALILMLVATVWSIHAAYSARSGDARNRDITQVDRLNTEVGQLNAEIDRLKNELSKLRLLQKAPTSYVDKFPDNIPSITELVRKTGDRLVVITDYCAYGHYSAPESYREYKAALAAIIAKKRTVEVHVYDETTASKMTLSQFGLDETDPRSTDERFAEERATPRFKQYFDYHRRMGDPKPVPDNPKEFDDLMQQEQSACIAELRSQGVRIRNDIKNPLPVFVWIRDRDEAIFSVYNLGKNVREVSLTTRDPSLVGLLSDLADSVRPTR